LLSAWTKGTALREKALDAFHQLVDEEEKQPKGKQAPMWRTQTRSELLEIYLTEKDDERAWATLKGGPTTMRL